MLKNTFFEIVQLSQTSGKIISTIKINPGHQIFEGHFPGMPVTPGVVQIQMVREILEHVQGKKLGFVFLSRCKFLAILNPNQTPEITITINLTDEENILKISALGEQGEIFYFKFNAVLK